MRTNWVRQAVEHLEQIVTVPGVDSIYVGPFDLCLSLGLGPLAMPHPEVDAVVQRLLELGRRHGVAVGMGAGSPEEVRRYRQQGCTLLGYSTDYAMLVGAARSGLAARD